MQTDCTEGHGTLDRDGYHQQWVPSLKKTISAHRWAYSKQDAKKLQQIKGLVVRHKCNNPGCVNPEHLVIGTHGDNVADRVAAGRCAHGTLHPNAELTQEQAEEMRAMYVSGSQEYGTYALARKFKVSQRTAWKVVTNKAYKVGTCEPLTHS